MRNIIFLFTLILVGCDHDSGASASGTLDVAFVNSVVQRWGLTVIGTALIHEDGLQGETYDFDRVIVSRAGNTGSVAEPEILVFAYSILHPETYDSNIVVAFYIDADADIGTGQPIEGIGADYVLYDTGIFRTTGFRYDDYAIWDQVNSSWVGQMMEEASYTSHYTYSDTKAIVFPIYKNISELLLLNDARGVLAVRSLDERGDANGVTSMTLGSTAIFTFSSP